jgi:hypothetical protein
MRYILAVNPTVERGRNPRDLTMRDIVSRPVSIPGRWRMVDLLDGPVLAALHRRFYKDR